MQPARWPPIRSCDLHSQPRFPVGLATQHQSGYADLVNFPVCHKVQIAPLSVILKRSMYKALCIFQDEGAIKLLDGGMGPGCMLA